jgi:predicted O-methyltransferase YrrM
MMPDLLDSRVSAYLSNLLPPRDPLLLEMEAQAAREHIPISGPHVGRFLAVLIRLARPFRVLEIGTAIGYGAIWMGRALREYGGQLQTIDPDERRVQQARANLSRAELSDVVEVVPGRGVETLARMEGTEYGLIFIDAVKAEYPMYLERAVPRLSSGGLLVADNALLGGEVSEEVEGGYWSPADRQGIRAYNSLAFSHTSLDTVILPLRDGLTLSLKR